jgi:hypothetical protein
MARLASRRHFRDSAAVLARPALEMARRIDDKATLAYVLNIAPWATWGPDDDLGERLRLADEMVRLAVCWQRPSPSLNKLAVEEEAPAAPAPRTTTEYRFQKESDVWAIAYEGQALRLKDSKGLQYLAELMRREGQEIHAADLAAGTAAGASTEGVRDLGHAGEVLDAQARAEYRERLRDLEADLEEATRWSDVGRAARISEEIEFLKDELSAAFGVGGRARKAGDVAERARKAVASRIRDAIERIRKEHRALALHLENAVRTGAFCCYRPDRSPGWKV